MNMFEQAMRMFTAPYARPDGGRAEASPERAKPEPSPNDELADLRRKLDEMGRQIDRLSKT
jgi:polyhydroxyalkanoate synthesis regulator protein